MGDDKSAKKDQELGEKIAEAQKKAEKEAPQGEEIEKLQKELNEMTEMAKRAVAEMQNLKRRFEEDKRQFLTFANLELIRALLPVIDNFERALTHTPKEAAEWCKGIEMSLNQLHQALAQAGLTSIEVELGAKFNPDFHEALAQDTGEKDTILEVFEKGYILGDRVIRHAKVKVGNGH